MQRLPLKCDFGDNFCFIQRSISIMHYYYSTKVDTEESDNKNVDIYTDYLNSSFIWVLKSCNNVTTLNSSKPISILT